MCCVFLLCNQNFFFVKQKTAYDMRISDWSSDVCSSDLPAAELCLAGLRPGAEIPRPAEVSRLLGIEPRRPAAFGARGVGPAGQPGGIPRRRGQLRPALIQGTDARHWHRSRRACEAAAGLVDRKSVVEGKHGEDGVEH